MFLLKKLIIGKFFIILLLFFNVHNSFGMKKFIQYHEALDLLEKKQNVTCVGSYIAGISFGIQLLKNQENLLPFYASALGFLISNSTYLFYHYQQTQIVKNIKDSLEYKKLKMHYFDGNIEPHTGKGLQAVLTVNTLYENELINQEITLLKWLLKNLNYEYDKKKQNYLSLYQTASTALFKPNPTYISPFVPQEERCLCTNQSLIRRFQLALQPYIPNEVLEQFKFLHNPCLSTIEMKILYSKSTISFNQLKWEKLEQKDPILLNSMIQFYLGHEINHYLLNLLNKNKTITRTINVSHYTQPLDILKLTQIVGALHRIEELKCDANAARNALAAHNGIKVFNYWIKKIKTPDSLSERYACTHPATSIRLERVTQFYKLHQAQERVVHKTKALRLNTKY